MAKRRKPARRPSTAAQRQQRRRHRQAERAAHRTEREPDLIAQIGRALDSEPLDLIAQASSVLAALDPRSRSPLERREPTGPSRDEFVATLLDVPSLETSALLAVMAALIPDELARVRIRRELAARPFALPDWLLDLADVRPYRTVELTDPLGDGDDIMLAARLADGSELTALVYVDHNLGSIVKDAFVLPAPLDEVLAKLPEAADEDATVSELDPATARARLADAIKHGTITLPPCETDTWPACRPVVEWLCAGLPDGGPGYEYREWSEAELAEIRGRFLASPFGAGFDDPDHRGLLDDLLWYGSGYAGHPLRVSPVTVEIILVDWVPRKIVADQAYLAQLPGLLRAWVRFAHAERGIRPDLTEATLAAVDEYEPDYLDIIGKPRLQGPAALLARMGALDPDDPWPEFDTDDDAGEFDGDLDEGEFAAICLGLLAERVGGPDTLDDLDDTPLPDEEFDRSLVPTDLRDEVDEILVLCDSVCDALLDVECRTACRRLLTRIVANGPDVLRRRAKTPNTAAAITWAVGRSNSRFSAARGGLTAKRLMEHFGVSASAQSRARSLIEAAGLRQRGDGCYVGAPELLIASERARIVELRDYYDNYPGDD